MFPTSGEGRETHTLLGPLETVNLSLWTTHIVDKVQNLSNSECYTPSCILFDGRRIY
jgi:hypothetical protein